MEEQTKILKSINSKLGWILAFIMLSALGGFAKLIFGAVAIGL